jgi:bifunctional non-homologous end joining protein LigD
VAAAKDAAVRLEAVADDPAAAVVASGRKRMDCALEAVEDVRVAAERDLERLVVLVAAHLAARHVAGVPVVIRGQTHFMAAVEIHHPDQLWWQGRGLRKSDAIAYYRAISPVLLPHLRDRPLTLKRHYNGPRSPFEWIKDAPPDLPEWIRVSPQPAKSRGGARVRYVVVDSLDALLWLVDWGCIDFHVWTSRTDRPDRPDYVLFDLDPAGVGFAEVVEAAQLLREALEALGLESHVKTTGGEGLHVHVPIARRHTHEQAREFAQVVAGALVRASRGLVTGERSPTRRHGVFIDTKMNGHGQQLVCAYSLRPTPAASVATPVGWDELEGLDPQELTPGVVLERVEQGGDPFARVVTGRRRLPI